MLTVVEVIAARFVSGHPAIFRHVADVTSIPESTVARIIEHFVRDGWLHHVRDREAAVTLAKPPEQMQANELVELGFKMVDEGDPGRHSAFVQSLREAQQKVADRISLATILEDRPALAAVPTDS